MTITSFNISSDRTQLELNLTNAALANTLRIWKNSDYKDYSKAVDLSSKLDSTSDQSIQITLSELNINYFDGVYFVEVASDSEVLDSLTADLTKYKECILNKLREVSICEDCPPSDVDLQLINLQGVLFGLEIAIEQGFINEILLKLETIEKFCSDDCVTCGEKNNITDTNYYSTND